VTTDDAGIGNSKTTPLITTTYSGTTYPILLESAFTKGTEVKQDEMSYYFSLIDIGKIKIETGKIIACDPIVMNEAIAFTQKFPLGQFSVQLAMAKIENDERVAFSRILFSDKPVEKWSFALQPGQNLIELKDTTIYCYGVDAGTGIFIDSAVNKVFTSFKYNTWENVFVKKAEESNYTGYIHNFGAHNIAIFSTGYGDGCYSTYIGFDKSGNVCRLLTDFGLIEWWKK
jgi:hypothetical protein